MGLLNIGRYAADTPDPAPSGRFVSHPNVVNRLADAYRRRPYSNTITARPMYAIAPTGEQNDIREERGLYHARWYVADEPCGQHGEEREAECASKKRFCRDTVFVFAPVRRGRYTASRWTDAPVECTSPRICDGAVPCARLGPHTMTASIGFRRYGIWHFSAGTS